MSQETRSATPKMKYKTFKFNTQLNWIDNRAGMLQADGKPGFRVASPPEFKGETGVWTPEDLYVASVDICTLTTFAAFAQKKNLPIISYRSQAEGILEFVDGKYRFTKIFLRPQVVVGSKDAIEMVEQTLHDAHKSCLIANSIRTEVIVEPVISGL